MMCRMMLKRPAARLILLAIATGLAFLANSRGNTVLMCVAGAALAVTEGWILLTKPTRLPWLLRRR